MVRPRIPADLRRNHRVIRVPVNRHENDHIRFVAGQAGLTDAAFMRAAAMGVNVRAKASKNAHAVIRELAAIGNNLNQLAREANAGRYPSEARLLDVLREIENAVRRIE